MPSDFGFLLENRHRGAGKSNEQTVRRGKPDDSTADDRNRGSGHFL